MPINQQTYQNFYMVPIDNTNSYLLKDLVRYQAMHHKCKCVWDSGDKQSFERLQTIVDNNVNGTGGFYIFANGRREPDAYVIHMPIVSEQGSGLYLEDICVRPQCRHSGLGLFAMSELANLAEETGRQYLSWVVAGNNEDALRFYERFEAQGEETVPYFMSSADLRVSDHDYLNNTEELTRQDLLRVRQFCHYNGFSNAFAAFEDGHRLVASVDERGRINAISMGSINTSTFRAVQGLDVSEVLFSRELRENDNLRLTVQNNLINRNIDISAQTGTTGHMIWGINRGDKVLQNSICERFNAEILIMTDEPESILNRKFLDSRQMRKMVQQHKARVIPQTRYAAAAAFYGKRGQYGE